jgi:hypothetical protein
VVLSEALGSLPTNRTEISYRDFWWPPTLLARILTPLAENGVDPRSRDPATRQHAARVLANLAVSEDNQVRCAVSGTRWGCSCAGDAC